MAKKQGPKEKEIVGRVMHEFKHGELESSSGRKVKNPRQAIAIALHEAGASRDETPARNRRNLAHTESKQRQAETGRKGGSGGKRASPARPHGGGHAGGGQTRAALYDEATKRGIPGRSRMTKEQLAKALSRRYPDAKPRARRREALAQTKRKGWDPSAGVRVAPVRPTRRTATRVNSKDEGAARCCAAWRDRAAPARPFCPWPAPASGRFPSAAAQGQSPK